MLFHLHLIDFGHHDSALLAEKEAEDWLYQNFKNWFELNQKWYNKQLFLITDNHLQDPGSFLQKFKKTQKSVTNWLSFPDKVSTKEVAFLADKIGSVEYRFIAGSNLGGCLLGHKSGLLEWIDRDPHIQHYIVLDGCIEYDQFGITPSQRLAEAICKVQDYHPSIKFCTFRNIFRLSQGRRSPNYK